MMGKGLRSLIASIALLTFLLLVMPVQTVWADPTVWNDLGIIYTAPVEDAYYPSVIYDADGFGGGSPLYKMWYSDGEGNVFVVTSTDGLTWGAPTALTGLGDDAHHVQVLFDANCFGATSCDLSAARYRIWYWDTDAGLYTISSIATAESASGVNWSNDQAITQDGTSMLVTGAGSGWNRGSYGPIFLIYQAGATNCGTEPWDYSYVMYYDGTDGASEFTGLAYSTDGFHWTAYTANPVLNGSATPAWDCSDSAYGTVRYDGSSYHFWYCGGGGDNGSGGCQQSPVHEGIGYASSADGKNWTKHANNPIFHIDDGVSYRDSRTYTPAVVDDGSGQLKMYYSARQSGSGQAKKIGLAVNAPDVVYVDDDWSGLALGTQIAVPGDPNPHFIGLDAFDTVEGGVSAVAPSGTVHVMAGTYNPTGTIAVNKPVTILGPQAGVDPRPSYASTRTPGDANTEAVIDANLQYRTIIRIGADNVVLDGLHVREGSGDMIESEVAISNAVLRYNILSDAGDEAVQLRECTYCVVEYNHVYDIAQDGINLCCGSTSGYIMYNEVHNNWSENAAIYVYGSTHMTIQCNLVYDVFGNDGIKLGSKGGGDASLTGGSILYNTVHDTVQDGISVYTSDTVVQGNEVYHSTSENGAIYVAYGVSNITISYNDVHDNTLATWKWGDPGAIMIGTAVDASTIHVNHNNIYGNLPNGVTNKATALLDATNNWWGAADGPGPGSGDHVSTNVDFASWLTEPQVIVNPCIPDREGPVTTDVVATPNPVAVGGSVHVTALVDDSSTGGSNVASANYAVYDSLGNEVASGSMLDSFDSPTVSVSADFTAPGDAGIYDLCVWGTDQPQNVGDPECIMLVVYDPEGGFVTGGGWIWSEPGACKTDDTLAGKATFGFVSKYKKGANIPTGQTEFQFKAADLNFHSTSYDWLVVNQAGTRAQFKGWGTINGAGDYRFMLWAGEGEPDTFRIKIWEEDESDNETVIYDNGSEQAIGGGSIVIHTKKK